MNIWLAILIGLSFGLSLIALGFALSTHSMRFKTAAECALQCQAYGCREFCERRIRTARLEDGESMARRFHETYERLAPEFGYKTRKNTRTFDPQSSNGRLMIAVCNELISNYIRLYER